MSVCLSFCLFSLFLHSCSSLSFFSPCLFLPRSFLVFLSWFVFSSSCFLSHVVYLPLFPYILSHNSTVHYISLTHISLCILLATCSCFSIRISFFPLYLVSHMFLLFYFYIISCIIIPSGISLPNHVFVHGCLPSLTIKFCVFSWFTEAFIFISIILTPHINFCLSKMSIFHLHYLQPFVVIFHP